MTTSFVPKGQQGLLLRSPTTQFYTSPSYPPKSLLYSRTMRQSLESRDAQRLDDESVPARIGFFTRHNPHPQRVRHIKGLLDLPICMVEDNVERRFLWSPPTGEDYCGYVRPRGSTRYGSNRDKHIPAVGIVPITYAWRDELERKTHNAIIRAMGQIPTSASYAHQNVRAGGSRAGNFDNLEEDKLLDLLCRILQTDSIPACQAWLSGASETEKTIVLNILRMAATGEINPNPQQPLPNPQKPIQKESERSDRISNPCDDGREESHVQDASDFQWSSADLPFKLPEHDTVVRRSHSRLSSRQSSVHSSTSFHQRLQNELDKQASVVSSRLCTPYSKTRQRAASVSGSIVSADSLARQRPPSLYRHSRPRSRSAGAVRSASHREPQKSAPPPPVKVEVVKETLNKDGKYGSPHQRYTARWINSH